MLACSSSSRTVWRQWACRPARTAKLHRLARSRRQWPMSRTRVVMGVSLWTSPVPLASSRTHSVPRTAPSWTWHRSHHHRLRSSSSRSRLSSKMWWSKCRFRRSRACRSLTRSAPPSNRWTRWLFKCAFLSLFAQNSKFFHVFKQINSSSKILKTSVQMPRNLTKTALSDSPGAEIAQFLFSKKTNKKLPEN